METVIGIIIILLIIIAYWRYVLIGAIGAVIFGFIGSLFGDIGTLIGAILGFYGGIKSKIDEDKKEQQNISYSQNSSDNSYLSDSSSSSSSSYCELPEVTKECIACSASTTKENYRSKGYNPHPRRAYLCDNTHTYGYRCDDCGTTFHNPNKIYYGSYVICPGCGRDTNLYHNDDVA